jgi:hypothetical protein
LPEIIPLIKKRVFQEKFKNDLSAIIAERFSILVKEVL